MPPRPRKRTIAPEDLLRFVLVSDPRVAPDGSSVIFTRKHVGDKNEYVTNLWLVSASGGPARPFTAGGKDGRGRWSPDGASIAFVARRAASPQIHLIPAAGGEATVLTRFPEGAIADFKWSPDGKRIAVVFREAEAGFTDEARRERERTGASVPPRVIDEPWYRLDGDGYFNDRRFHLWLVDAATGEARKVFDQDKGFGFSFDWSPDSKELAIAANLEADAWRRPWQDRIYRLDAQTAKLRKLPGQVDGLKQSVTWSPDGKHLAWAGRDDARGLWYEANFHLYVCPAEGGRPRNLTGREDWCLVAETIGDTRDVGFVANLRWHPDGKRIFTTIGTRGETHVASIPIRGGKVAFHTRGHGEYALGNLSDDGRRLAVVHGSATELGEVHLGELAAGGRLETRPLTGFNAALLDEVELSRPEEHWVKSTGGTAVHVWVMKPPGWKAGMKVPAVLEVHGGPHAQYGWTFFHELQVLAARGYAVFYGNPRGSKGYGEKHAMAIVGNWGGPDWEDVQAITAFIREQPYVDRRRMAVAGGSYGGYMTAWAIGHTREFAAAIADRMVSNLVSFAGSSDFALIPGDYWQGAPWDGAELLWEQSAVRCLKGAKTPTLILHSEGDLRCNIEQAEQVFTALKQLGVPARFVRYPASASHGLSRSGPPDLRLHRLGQILEWLGRYIG